MGVLSALKNTSLFKLPLKKPTLKTKSDKKPRRIQGQSHDPAPNFLRHRCLCVIYHYKHMLKVTVLKGI